MDTLLTVYLVVMMVAHGVAVVSTAQPKSPLGTVVNAALFATTMLLLIERLL